MATQSAHRPRTLRYALACLIALATNANAQEAQAPETDLLMHSMTPHAITTSDDEEPAETMSGEESYDVRGGVFCIHPDLNENLASTYINQGYLEFAAQLAEYERLHVCRFGNLTAATPIPPATGPLGARAQQTDPIAGYETAEPVAFSFIRMQTQAQTVWLTVHPEQVDQ